MKPQTQGVQAQFPQQMEVSTAKIKMSAHMVDLLSSKVYTDKQSAVIRELSCNAYDAQVVAGNGDKQIQVHLPTRFEPYFEVKDCGTGLSDEDVKNLYMTYGESTKQDSNDVVGFLGIGSKSPFAYVDAFTVTSIHEGIERQYSVFKDQGIPKVIKLSEIATTEPNGFSVKIPVKEQDYHDFRVKAQRIYKFFEVKPSVNVELDLEINKVVETDSYFTVENSSYNRKAYAIMGQVVYELPNTSQVGKLLRLIRGSVYVKFNIGDVSPAASREHLSNDESTSLVVEDELDKILTKYLETVQAEVDTCDNFRNAFELANQKIQDNDIVNSHITFEGKLKKEWFEIVKENIDNFKTDFPHATVYIKNSSWYGRVSWDKEDNPHVDIARVGYYKQSVLFMIKDLKSGGIQAFKNLLGNGNRFCTGIIVDSQAKVDAIVSKLHLTPELVTVVKASEIHVKAVRGKSKKEVYVKRLNNNGRLVTVTLKDFDLNGIKKPVYYVQQYRKGYKMGEYQSNCISDLHGLITSGLFGSILFIHGDDLKKMNNPNVIPLTRDIIIGKVTPEMYENRKIGEFLNKKIDAGLYDMFKTSSLFSADYKKLARHTSKDYSSKLDGLLGEANHWCKDGTIPNKINKIAEEVTSVIPDKESFINKYKFLELFTEGYGNRLTIKPEHVQYVQVLIEAQDNGKIN